MITDTTRDCFAQLREIAERQGKGGPWLVLTHDNPDPDSLASALLLCRLLRSAFHQRAAVAYGGIIGRAENLEMFHSLRLRFGHIRDVSWRHYKAYALVDTQPR